MLADTRATTPRELEIRLDLEIGAERVQPRFRASHLGFGGQPGT